MYGVTDKKIQFIENKANELREEVIEMLLESGSGHTAGPLGTAEIFASLYFHILNVDPFRPNWEDRDRFLLSNGHICPILYATLANAGFFHRKELKNLRKLGSGLQGHPHRGSLSGIESSSGPLGLGLGQACGMALAARMNYKKWRTYVMMSDAEQQEGAIWEAAMFAGKYRLNNLTAIIDRNNIQIDGYTEDIMPIEPLKEKYESFGWHVIDIDGHNPAEIIAGANIAHAIYEKPTLLIAYTIPGKGVDFMENDYRWHGKSPTAKEAEEAVEQIKAANK